MDENDTLRQQIEYYRARAPEYDEWFLREGRYDRGPEARAVWEGELETVRRALAERIRGGHVLELAAGTGWWTAELARLADRVTAVDASWEVLERNRARVASERVTYLKADLFNWTPPETYDAVVFGFWLSHVPPEAFEGFWNLVRRALRPEGSFFMVDSRYEPASTAVDHTLEGPESTRVTRKLNDGRTFRIVKVFYRPEELGRRLADLGWSAEFRETGTYFLYGSGSSTG